VLEGIEQNLAKAKAAFTAAMTKDVASFNKSMKGKLPAIAEGGQP